MVLLVHVFQDLVGMPYHLISHGHLVARFALWATGRTTMEMFHVTRAQITVLLRFLAQATFQTVSVLPNTMGRMRLDALLFQRECTNPALALSLVAHSHSAIQTVWSIVHHVDC